MTIVSPTRCRWAEDLLSRIGLEVVSANSQRSVANRARPILFGIAPMLSGSELNRLMAALRSAVEHPFRVLKRQFGYTKVRYRGIGCSGRYASASATARAGAAFGKSPPAASASTWAAGLAPSASLSAT